MDQLALGETSYEVEGASYVRDGELLCVEHLGLRLQVGKSEKPSADALPGQLTHSQTNTWLPGLQATDLPGINSSIKLTKFQKYTYCFGSSVGILNAFFEGCGTELSQHTIQSSITVGIQTVYLATAATVRLLVAVVRIASFLQWFHTCLLYTSPSPRDLSTSRMPSSA